MERRVWFAVAVLIVTMISACTAQGPMVRASPAASPSPTPTEISWGVSCPTTPSAAADPLVIAWSSDRQNTLIYSLADPTNPRTLCTVSGAAIVRFISGSEIGFVTTSTSNDPVHGTSLIERMSLTDLNLVAVTSVHGDVMDLAWSPDGSSVAYLLATDAPGLGSGTADQLWLKTGSNQPVAITPFMPVFGRDGSVDDQNIVRFSRDGKYLLMVDTFAAGAAPASPDEAVVQVHAADGSLVFVPQSALGASGNKFGPLITMAGWAHQSDRLFYRDQAGVHTWDPPSTVGLMAAGLAWYSPLVSQDDRYLAYTVMAGGTPAGGPPHVEIRDPVSNTVRVIPGVRSAQSFISESKLLEAEYVPNTPGLGPAYIPNGREFVFDLLTHVETSVAAISPTDYWPN